MDGLLHPLYKIHQVAHRIGNYDSSQPNITEEALGNVAKEMQQTAESRYANASAADLMDESFDNRQVAMKLWRFEQDKRTFHDKARNRSDLYKDLGVYAEQIRYNKLTTLSGDDAYKKLENYFRYAVGQSDALNRMKYRGYQTSDEAKAAQLLRENKEASSGEIAQIRSKQFFLTRWFNNLVHKDELSDSEVVTRMKEKLEAKKASLSAEEIIKKKIEIGLVAKKSSPVSSAQKKSRKRKVDSVQKDVLKLNDKVVKLVDSRMAVADPQLYQENCLKAYDLMGEWTQKAYEVGSDGNEAALARERVNFTAGRLKFVKALLAAALKENHAYRMNNTDGFAFKQPYNPTYISRLQSEITKMEDSLSSVVEQRMSMAERVKNPRWLEQRREAKEMDEKAKTREKQFEAKKKAVKEQKERAKARARMESEDE